MCGIVGAIGFEMNRSVKTKALDLISHRGPDGEGEFSINEDNFPVWIGHRRLKILDLSDRSAQPMISEDGRYVLTYNGELYNAKPVRSILESEGYRFFTSGDTEVLLKSFERWGVNCINRLEGMFAFSVWDRQSQSLYMARDRLGMKPLYFFGDSGKMAFSSEATALAAILRTMAPLQLSDDALGYLLIYGYIPSPHAIWKGMRKLMPGQHCIWSRGNDPVIEHYWQPPTKIKSSASDSEEQVEEFGSLFEQITLEHMQSDVPVGLFLSGGNDSMAVGAAMSKTSHREELIAYTLGFESVNDEVGVASQAASELKLEHHIEQIKRSDIDSLIEKTMRAYDEPLLLSAILSMDQVCEGAVTKRRVMLAGDGGDEVFAGYQWYRHLKKMRDQPASSSVWMANAISRITKDPLRHRALGATWGKSSQLTQHCWSVFPRFTPHEVEILFRPMNVRFGINRAMAPIAFHDVDDLPLRRRMQRIDLMTFGADLCCAKVDRAAMSKGMEVRTPFFDRRVVEWGLALRPDKAENNVGKPLVKKYLKRRFQEKLIYQSKKGFSVPLAKLVDRQKAINKVLKGKLIEQNILSSDAVKRLNIENDLGFARLMMLYLLDSWYRIVSAKLDANE